MTASAPSRGCGGGHAVPREEEEWEEEEAVDLVRQMNDARVSERGGVTPTTTMTTPPLKS